MHAVEIIAKKRDGLPLSTEEINWFIQSYTAGDISDYQAAALLMAIFIRGMDRQETVDLTLAMAASGDRMDLSDVVDYAVDKHSSGGVGDKTSLVVLPIVAACGVPVAKMSGRGLGFSGGTLDKVEAITGWQTNLPRERFKKQVRDIGIALAGQTADLAPADGKLYALRDVTATVSSIPLIAGSIMSKKLAAGADAIVLDVKVGSGAFMRTVPEARQLAETMVKIGTDAGRTTVAVLSDMNQPLGYAIGNGLETREAILTMQQPQDPAAAPPDFREHCIEIAGHMLVLASAAANLPAARQMATAALDDGRAWHKFRQLVEAQGGHLSQVDNPDQLLTAPAIGALTAPQTAYLAAINTSKIGWTCVHLGGGRVKKSDTIDPAVGIEFKMSVGERVTAGQEIGTIHAATEADLRQAQTEIMSALSWSADQTEPLPQFYGTITHDTLGS